MLATARKIHRDLDAALDVAPANRNLMPLTCYFIVELPGIEPVSGCWSLSRAGTELRNDTYCDSPELTSVDTECAQNVPSQSLD
jgi:hypothetical protein